MSRSFYIFLIKNFCIFFWPLLTSCSAFSYRPLFYKSGSCNSKFFLCVPSCQDNSGSFPFSQHGSFYIRSFSLWSDKYNIHLHRILFSMWSGSLFSLLLLLHFWQLSVWSQSVLPVLPAFEFPSVFYHPTVCLLFHFPILFPIPLLSLSAFHSLFRFLSVHLPGFWMQ